MICVGPSSVVPEGTVLRRQGDRLPRMGSGEKRSGCPAGYRLGLKALRRVALVSGLPRTGSVLPFTGLVDVLVDRHHCQGTQNTSFHHAWASCFQRRCRSGDCLRPGGHKALPYRTICRDRAAPRALSRRLESTSGDRARHPSTGSRGYPTVSRPYRRFASPKPDNKGRGP